MAVSNTTRKPFDLKCLPTLPGLKVIRVEVEDYTDSAGEPSFRVTVILDESVDIEKVTGEAVGDLKSAIHEKLREGDADKFAYIFLAKPSELAETNEE